VIAGVPVATPDTMPVAAPIVAKAVLPLVHVPPVFTSVSAVVAPVQTVNGPVIAAGVKFTVIGTKLEQPASVVYTIVSTPAVAPPVTTPLDDPTVASVVLLLLHEPPVVASVRVIADPVHTLFAPAIATGV
jgi:hypothetical protein